MSKVLIIVGSTRPARAADLVVPWVTSRALAHPGFDVEVADLRGIGRCRPGLNGRDHNQGEVT
jgi:hypothetical protein